MAKHGLRMHSGFFGSSAIRQTGRSRPEVHNLISSGAKSEQFSSSSIRPICLRHWAVQDDQAPERICPVSDIFDQARRIVGSSSNITILINTQLAIKRVSWYVHKRRDSFEEATGHIWSARRIGKPGSPLNTTINSVSATRLVTDRAARRSRGGPIASRRSA